MKDLIIQLLKEKNADFSINHEFSIDLPTKEETIKIDIETHWLGKRDYIQVHHLELYGNSISDTGFRSHFVLNSPDITLSIEEFAEGLESFILQLQAEERSSFLEYKEETLKKSQLSIF